MDSRVRVLLVEDDERLAAFTREFFEQSDVEVVHVADGEAALAAATRSVFDAVILDLMWPRVDGLSVCRRLREQSAVPILMTTARAAETDQVLGFELGADDYVPKPFSVRELLERVRSAVRRSRGQVGPQGRSLRVGPLSLQLESMTATLAGQPLELTTYRPPQRGGFRARLAQLLGREEEGVQLVPLEGARRGAELAAPTLVALEVIELGGPTDVSSDHQPSSPPLRRAAPLQPTRRSPQAGAARRWLVPPATRPRPSGSSVATWSALPASSAGPSAPTPGTDCEKAAGATVP